MHCGCVSKMNTSEFTLTTFPQLNQLCLFHNTVTTVTMEINKYIVTNNFELTILRRRSVVGNEACDHREAILLSELFKPLHVSTQK